MDIHILVFEPYPRYKIPARALNVRSEKILQILPFISKPVRFVVDVILRSL